MDPERARLGLRSRPPSAVFDRGHAFSVDVSSESKLSSEPSTSNVARLRRAVGLHSGGPTPSSSIFPAPTPIRANLRCMARSICAFIGELAGGLALQLSSTLGDSEASRNLGG